MLIHNQYCMLCQIDLTKDLLGICKFCNSILPWIKQQNYRCHKCLGFIPNNYRHIICENCQNNPPKFHKIFAIFEYLPPIKNILFALKFNQNLAYAKFLGKFLFLQVTNLWYLNNALPEAIIPVPLHIDRLRNRGFNQSIELAKEIQSIIKIENNFCFRKKNTLSQNTLLKNQRKENTYHAFQANYIPYKHIAIIDDIVTTTSTVRSLSKAIIKNNPKLRIDIWTIARA